MSMAVGLENRLEVHGDGNHREFFFFARVANRDNYKFFDDLLLENDSSIPSRGAPSLLCEDGALDATRAYCTFK
jgi:hypothetical protein